MQDKKTSTLEDVRKNDREFTSFLGIKTFARVVGYCETGEPIELVYVLKTDEYELHIGGEYVDHALPAHIFKWAN